MEDYFEKLFLGVGAVVVSVIMIAVAALLSGTILWLIWPYALPIIFPKAVASGILISNIPWFSAVALTWVCGILLKSTNYNRK
jgi:hypothetical protein